MNNAITIRPAVLADVDAILKIVAKVVPLMQAAGNQQWSNDYPNREVFEQDIALNQLWVAEIDGQIAGISAITTEQYEEYKQVGWDITETAIVTHRLAADPDFKGKGIAKALMQQAEHVAVERGIPLLRVDTSSKNEATNGLFPKLGYVFAGQITLRFREGQYFYCYEKRLA